MSSLSEVIFHFCVYIIIHPASTPFVFCQTNSKDILKNDQKTELKLRKVRALTLRKLLLKPPFWLLIIKYVKCFDKFIRETD